MVVYFVTRASRPRVLILKIEKSGQDARVTAASYLAAERRSWRRELLELMTRELAEKAVLAAMSLTNSVERSTLESSVLA